MHDEVVRVLPSFGRLRRVLALAVSPLGTGASGARRSIRSVADVLLLAVDSWGGVASMIALAGGLRDLGVSTRIAAYSDFGDKVRAAGCEFVDLEVSLAGWWESQNAQQ